MSETIRVMLPEEDIEKRIREMGAAITADYEGEEVFVIGVLRGAAWFTCELVKRIDIPVTVDFIQVSSYGSGTVSSGEVVFKQDVELDFTNKHVIICEDIIDSGNTLHALLPHLKDRGAKTVEAAVLLDKPDRREVDVDVKYTGFSIPDEFVVGYGLDYDQKYRNLPYIGVCELN